MREELRGGREKSGRRPSLRGKNGCYALEGVNPGLPYGRQSQKDHRLTLLAIVCGIKNKIGKQETQLQEAGRAAQWSLDRCHPKVSMHCGFTGLVTKLIVTNAEGKCLKGHRSVGCLEMSLRILKAKICLMLLSNNKTILRAMQESSVVLLPSRFQWFNSMV